MIRNEQQANIALAFRAENRFKGDLGPKREPKWTPPKQTILRRIAERLGK